MEITAEQINEAYRGAESMIRDAVQGSKTPESFQSNLAQLQIYATRILAVLIYNASVQNKDPNTGQMIEKVTTGIVKELNEIITAGEQGKVESAEVKFDA